MGGCSSSTAALTKAHKEERGDVCPVKEAAPTPDVVLTIDSPATAKGDGAAGPSATDDPEDWAFDFETQTYKRKAKTQPAKVLNDSEHTRKLSNPHTATTDQSSIQLSDLDFDEGALALFSEANKGTVHTNKRHVSVLRADQAFASSQVNFKWKKCGLIGVGAFGRVFLGINLDTQEQIAVKSIDILGPRKDPSKRDPVEMVENEVMVLNRLRHINIVQYIGTDRETSDPITVSSLNIFMEYIDGGSLSGAIRKCKSGLLTEACSQSYTYQLLMGLRYLHYMKIAHRDIKPANILLTKARCGNCKFTLKIADFGASKMLGEMARASEGGMMTLTGTPHYMAPEVVLQTGHGRKADIWSLGCCCVEMLSGEPPWGQDTAMGVLFKIGTSAEPPPYPTVSRTGEDFLTETFTYNFRERPSASSLMRHPWFAGVARHFMEVEDLNASKRRDREARRGSAPVDQQMVLAAAVLEGEVTGDAPSVTTSTVVMKPQAMEDRPIRPTPKSVRDYFSRMVKEDRRVSELYAEDERLRLKMESLLMNESERIDYDVDDNYVT